MLAILLQLLPISRLLFTNPFSAAAGPGTVFQCIVGASILLGGYDVVSGASTVITSPREAVGTNSASFYYRITAGPEVPNTYSATPLPPGLACNTKTGKITGAPTQQGVWEVTLTASDHGDPARTCTALLALTIVAGSGSAGTSILTVTTTGLGTIVPNLNGQSLVVGQTYNMTATPGDSHVFSGWSGDIVSTDPALSFVMQSNMVLQADFIPDPFPAVEGTYSGLSHSTNTVSQESSGFLTLTMKDDGAFRARMQLNGIRHTFDGQFDAGGNASATVVRPNASPLSIELRADLTNGTDEITGAVSDGTWEAALRADRAAFGTGNPSPYAGEYSIRLVAVPAVSQGTATVTVDTKGALRLKGVLPDGTKLKQKTSLSKTGDWPLYVPLSNGGCLMGWINLGSGLPADYEGQVIWFDPDFPGGYQELMLSGAP